MRAWILAGALVMLAACGGNVVLDGSNGVGGATGAGGAGGGVAMPCVASCADAITNGGEPCATNATAETDYAALASCAAAMCASECSEFELFGADAACSACLAMGCSSEQTACANN